MVKKLLFAVFLLYSTLTYAETIKMDVLVIGGTASGTAAAIQSARSKVKTMLIVSGKSLINEFGTNTVQVTGIEAGIWGEFSNKVREFYNRSPKSDTLYSNGLKFEPFTGANILKAIADTVKNLTIKTDAPFTAIKRDGTGWEVSITVNGKTDVVKTKILVDATGGDELLKKAGATHVLVLDDLPPQIFRTSIAINGNNYIPLMNAVVYPANNILVTERLLSNRSVEQLPAQLSIGQGIGCIAAYCAFFKTTTKDLKPRVIQQELLDFKGLLLPFADIKPDNKYIRAIQQIGATGLLKGRQTAEGLLFLPDATVNTAEVKPVLNEIYSRAFLWFDKEKPGELFTIGNTLSLISEFTLTDPETLQANLQKDWQDKYKFTTTFDMKRPITRLEFAVLVNKFLNPFARKIDLEGNMVN